MFIWGPLYLSVLVKLTYQQALKNLLPGSSISFPSWVSVWFLGLAVELEKTFNFHAFADKWLFPWKCLWKNSSQTSLLNHNRECSHLKCDRTVFSSHCILQGRVLPSLSHTHSFVRKKKGLEFQSPSWGHRTGRGREFFYFINSLLHNHFNPGS